MPRPVVLTQIDDEDYEGIFAPEPLVVVGDIPGAGGGGSVAWADVTGKPVVIGAGATQAEARTAIGAGTGNGNSNVAVATTAPAALAATAAVGTGTTAARADHVHPFPTAANVGAPTIAQYNDLLARVVALETP